MIQTQASRAFYITHLAAHYLLLLGEREGGERRTVAKVIECVKAHYEVEDVQMGKVYRWCPQSVVLECTCGEQLTLTAFKTTCPECGADHEAIAQEMLVARPEDEGDHPWRSLQPHTPMRGA
jgi:hypothetical protein